MKFDFSDFSKKRSQLMGISMLLIMIFHCGLYLNSRYTPFCVVGVEFFLVISAIGLFFSLSKNQDKLSFYKKRVLRILPTYLIVAAPYFAHNQKFEIGNYLFNGLVYNRWPTLFLVYRADIDMLFACTVLFRSDEVQTIHLNPLHYADSLSLFGTAVPNIGHHAE